ncbi:hypothetical protein D3C80_2151380 [compost metagenome]
MGIDAVHGLAESILDQETQHQALNVLPYVNLNFQHHGLADFGDFHRALALVQQAHTMDGCFTGT